MDNLPGHNNKKMIQKLSLSDFSLDKKTGVHRPSSFESSKDESFNYTDGTDVESNILEIVKGASDLNCDSEELMEAVNNWPSYYHLGAGRPNIFRALKLDSKSMVLELGCGCGAITRYLGERFKGVDAVEGSLQRAQITKERCRDLNNIKVFCSDVNLLRFNSQYDVVTLIGVLEYAPSYSSNMKGQEACLSLIKTAQSALNPDGLLVIAIENKIGIKYWSGCPEDHTGVLYEGIHNYPRLQATPETFSKKELEDLLRRAGFQNIYFYYCFPDYKFASVIFSDIGKGENLYLHNWIGTPFWAHGALRNHSFHEGLALRTLSQAGILREFANSFLVIASQKPLMPDNLPDWIAKALPSFNRKKEFRCFTTFKNGLEPYIEKIRVQEARTFSEQEFQGGKFSLNPKHKVFRMPWIRGDLLIFEIYEALFEKNFKERILKLLKEYYQEVKRLYATGERDEEGFPLLKGNSIDFIFRNIIRKDGHLFPIDDEWEIDKSIPADYLLYRCIKADIIESQYPWITKKIKNPDRFTKTLIKAFFPGYGEERQKKNKLLEKSFQDFVSSNVKTEAMVGLERFPFLRKKFVAKLVKLVWSKIPIRGRFMIRKLLGI